MEKTPNFTQNIEKEMSPEKGMNVLVKIDLIRHPEKDHATGKLTEKGKKDFFDNLMKEFQEGEKYDTVKFYVSSLPRGQEAKEPILSFLEATGITTKIRDKKELAGGSIIKEIGPSFIAEMTRVLEGRNKLSAKEINEAGEVRIKGSARPHYEPPTKDFETKANELTIHEFFDQEIPGTSFTGKNIAGETRRVIDHFSKLASRLNSGSKVKLILVGHSGIIEHFTKYVYLQNHKELTPKDVDAGMIGGVLGFGEGPEITIQSDESGKQKIKVKFKDLDLKYESGQ